MNQPHQPNPQKISKLDLPEQERVQGYMRHKWRLNHKPNSLRNSLKPLNSFSLFIPAWARTTGRIVRDDLEAFVESEQDGGRKSHLRDQTDVPAWLPTVSDRRQCRSEALLRRKIRLKLPDLLPGRWTRRCQQLLSVIGPSGIGPWFWFFWERVWGLASFLREAQRSRYQREEDSSLWGEKNSLDEWSI